MWYFLIFFDGSCITLLGIRIAAARTWCPKSSYWCETLKLLFERITFLCVNLINVATIVLAAILFLFIKYQLCPNLSHHVFIILTAFLALNCCFIVVMESFVIIIVKLTSFLKLNTNVLVLIIFTTITAPKYIRLIYTIKFLWKLLMVVN